MRDRAALVLIGLVSAAVLLAVGGLFLVPRSAGDRTGVVAALPALNAGLNGTSAVLLAAGFAAICRRAVAVHRACMLAALGVSTLFLVSYVVYHAHAGSVPFPGRGWIRPVYLALLLTHIVLAAAVVPLALTTVYRALSADLARHRRIARWTLPVWLYVSVTGVVIYWLLYHVYAPS